MELGAPFEPTLQRLEGRVAIVTGAPSGQAAATARLFVAHGPHVLLGDVAEDAGRALAAELGDAAAFVPLDVGSDDEWTSIVEDCIAAFGRIDVAVSGDEEVMGGRPSESDNATHARTHRATRSRCRRPSARRVLP